jgi:hypothetical protein
LMARPRVVRRVVSVLKMVQGVGEFASAVGRGEHPLDAAESLRGEPAEVRAIWRTMRAEAERAESIAGDGAAERKAVARALRRWSDRIKRREFAPRDA